MKAKPLIRCILPAIALSGLFFFCGEGPTNPYLAPYKITVSNNGPHYVGVELTETVTIEGEGLDSITISPDLPDSLKLDSTFSSQKGTIRGIPWSTIDETYRVTAHNQHGTKEIEWRLVVEDTNTYLDVASNPKEAGTVGLNPEPDYDHPTQNWYEKGATVSVTATPSTGYKFWAWTGSVTSDQQTIDVELTETKSLQAVFVATQEYRITPTVQPEGAGIIALSPNQDTYGPNQGVTAVAEANEGYTFLHWEGAAQGTSPSFPLVMDKDKNIVAIFARKTYTVLVEVSGSGTVLAGTESPAPVTEALTVEAGDSVYLSAQRNEGHVFSGWSGAVNSSEPSILFQVVQDSMKVKATFNEEGIITLSGSVSPENGGSVAAIPDKASYDEGESVTLKATPAEGFTFKHWKIADSTIIDDSISIIMDGNRIYTAIFEPKMYTIHITVEGSGTVSPESPISVAYGQTEILTATPGYGYLFVGWSGDTTSEGNELELFVDGDVSLTARFEPADTFTVSTEATPQNGGTISVSPQSDTYKYGDEIEIEGSAANGFSFVGWSGDAEGTQNPRTVTVTKSLNIQGVFVEKDKYTIRTSVSPKNAGIVTQTPEQASYEKGASVELSAQASDGFTFSEWSWDDSTATGESLDLTVDTSYIITAVFEKKAYTLTVTHDGNGTVSPSGDLPLEHGESRSITATPGSDYNFDKWTVVSGEAEIANINAQNSTVSVTSDATVKAGFKPKPKTATPSISPEGGLYQEEVTVSITCATNGATIYYTTDNTAPTTGSKVYPGPFIVSDGATVRAVAKGPSQRLSNEVSQAYTFNRPPTIEIVTPVNNDLLAGWIIFQVSVDDPDGSVDSVKFRNAGGALGSVSAGSGWVWTWKNATAGPHTIEAIAYDNSGSTASASVSFSVGKWEETYEVPATTGSRHISMALPSTGNPYVGTIRLYDEDGITMMERKVHKYNGTEWSAWDFSPLMTMDTVLPLQMDISQSDYFFSGYPDVSPGFAFFELVQYDPLSAQWSSFDDDFEQEAHIGIGTITGTDNAVAALCDLNYGHIHLYKYGYSGWAEMSASKQKSETAHDRIWVAGIGQDAYLLFESGSCYRVDDAGIYGLEAISEGGRDLTVADGKVYALGKYETLFRIAPGELEELPSVTAASVRSAHIEGDGKRLLATYIHDDKGYVKQYADGSWINFPKGSNGVVSTESGLSEIEISAKDGQVAVAVVCDAGIKVYRLIK